MILVTIYTRNAVLCAKIDVRLFALPTSARASKKYNLGIDYSGIVCGAKVWQKRLWCGMLHDFLQHDYGL